MSKCKVWQALSMGLIGLRAMVVVVVLGASSQAQDPVTFLADQWPCDLRVRGMTPGPGPSGMQQLGRLAPEKPITAPLFRGREYLAECESHETPVKLLAHQYVAPLGNFITGNFPKEVRVHPVAVLPNIVKAVASGGLDATAAIATGNIECKELSRPPNEPWARKSEQVIPSHRVTLFKGSRVELTGNEPLLCGDATFIEVKHDGSVLLFRGADFMFSYQDKRIDVFGPSLYSDFGFIR